MKARKLARSLFNWLFTVTGNLMFAFAWHKLWKKGI